MRTELVLFGKHFKLASRAQRRRLVAIFYAAFATLISAAWLIDPSGYGGAFFTMYFTALFGPILGGYLCGWLKPFNVGLVKPFGGNEVLKYSNKRNRSALSKTFYPEGGFPGIRNDERELSQRDHAHFIAYRALALIVMLAFFLQFTQSSPFFYKHVAFWTSFGFSTIALNRVTYVLLQAGYILALTLPPAVRLWTEPDMEPDIKEAQ